MRKRERDRDRTTRYISFRLVWKFKKKCHVISLERCVFNWNETKWSEIYTICTFVLNFSFETMWIPNYCWKCVISFVSKYKFKRKKTYCVTASCYIFFSFFRFSLFTDIAWTLSKVFELCEQLVKLLNGIYFSQFSWQKLSFFFILKFTI